MTIIRIIGKTILVLSLITMVVIGGGIYYLSKIGLGHVACYDETVFVKDTFRMPDGGVLIHYSIDPNTDYDPPGTKNIGGKHRGQYSHLLFFENGIFVNSIALGFEISGLDVSNTGEIYFSYSKWDRTNEKGYSSYSTYIGKLNKDGELLFLTKIRTESKDPYLSIKNSNIYLTATTQILDSDQSKYINDAGVLMRLDTNGKVLQEVELNEKPLGIDTTDNIYLIYRVNIGVNTGVNVKALSLDLQELWEVTSVATTYHSSYLSSTSEGTIVSIIKDGSNLYRHFDKEGNLVFEKEIEEENNYETFYQKPSFSMYNAEYYYIENSTIMKFNNNNNETIELVRVENLEKFIVDEFGLVVFAQPDRDILSDPINPMNGKSDVAIIQYNDNLQSTKWETYFGGPEVENPCS